VVNVQVTVEFTTERPLREATGRYLWGPASSFGRISKGGPVYRLVVNVDAANLWTGMNDTVAFVQRAVGLDGAGGLEFRLVSGKVNE